MKKNYLVTISLVGVSEEHVGELLNLLNAVSEILEIAGGRVLFMADELKIDEEELKDEIKA